MFIANTLFNILTESISYRKHGCDDKQFIYSNNIFTTHLSQMIMRPVCNRLLYVHVNMCYVVCSLVSLRMKVDFRHRSGLLTRVSWNSVWQFIQTSVNKISVLPFFCKL